VQAAIQAADVTDEVLNFITRMVWHCLLKLDNEINVSGVGANKNRAKDITEKITERW
jgi:hypothetical protein